MYSLRGGLGSLPNAMQKYLLEKGVEIRLKQPCSKLDFRDGKSLVWIYILHSNSSWVVVAVFNTLLSQFCDYIIALHVVTIKHP